MRGLWGTAPRQAVTAGGISRETPASPITHQADIPQIWCKIPKPHPSSGQVVLELWPSLLLHNALPCPLQWQLCRGDRQPGTQGMPASFHVKQGMWLRCFVAPQSIAVCVHWMDPPRAAAHP